MQIIVLATDVCQCGRNRVLLSHPVNAWRHADGNSTCSVRVAYGEFKHTQAWNVAADLALNFELETVGKLTARRLA